MSANAPQSNAPAWERWQHVCDLRQEIKLWLGGLANQQAMVIGRAPSALTVPRS